MGTQPLQPLYLLDDDPIRSSGDDKLAQDRYARHIAETALGTTGPFTIGVYGGYQPHDMHATRVPKVP